MVSQKKFQERQDVMARRLRTYAHTEKFIVEPLPELPPLNDGHRRQLLESIRERGILSPLVVSGRYIIDGRERHAIALELGLTEIPVKDLGTLEGPEQRREYAIRINAERRHLSPEQRRALLEAFIVAAPSKSSREVADAMKVDRSTVDRARRRLVEGGAVAPPAGVEGRDGKTYKKVPERKTSAPKPVEPEKVATVPAEVEERWEPGPVRVEPTRVVGERLTYIWQGKGIKEGIHVVGYDSRLWCRPQDTSLYPKNRAGFPSQVTCKGCREALDRWERVPPPIPKLDGYELVPVGSPVEPNGVQPIKGNVCSYREVCHLIDKTPQDGKVGSVARIRALAEVIGLTYEEATEQSKERRLDLPSHPKLDEAEPDEAEIYITPPKGDPRLFSGAWWRVKSAGHLVYIHNGDCHMVRTDEGSVRDESVSYVSCYVTEMGELDETGRRFEPIRDGELRRFSHEEFYENHNFDLATTLTSMVRYAAKNLDEIDLTRLRGLKWSRPFWARVSVKQMEQLLEFGHDRATSRRRLDGHPLVREAGSPSGET